MIWGYVAFVVAFVVAGAIVSAIWGWQTLKHDLEEALRIAFDDLQF